jgi:hypothetical protein
MYQSKSQDSSVNYQTKGKNITELVSNNENGTVFYHEIYTVKQPTHDENGQFSGDTDVMKHRSWSELNSVEGEGDIHVIRLPDDEVVIYRVIGLEDWSLPRVLRKGMEFNPVFKISRAGLGLIQTGLGNPPGTDDFNKDINGEDLSVTDQLFSMGDGIISIALAPTKVIKYAYGGTKLAYATDKSRLEKWTRYSSLPGNVRDVVKKNVFDQYFTFGASVIELDRIE